MREILFKGKRLNNSEWVYGFLLIDGITGKYFIHMSGNCLNESDKVGQEGCLMFVAFEVDPETACQHTGLTDKNGKKIFEGDIVKLADYDEDIPSKVVWDKNEAFFKLIDTDNYIASLAESEELIVIGNIFDNPDLLENRREGEIP